MKGTYAARAKTWALAETSKGDPQVAVEFALLDPEAEMKSLAWYGYFTENTEARTIEALRTMGWAGDDLSDLQGLDANEVSIVVEEEEYQGKIQTKVRWVNKAGGLNVKAPLSGDKAKAFATMMRDRIRALDAAKGVKKPAQPNGATRAPARSGPPEPPPMTDADIPF